MSSLVTKLRALRELVGNVDATLTDIKTRLNDNRPGPTTLRKVFVLTHSFVRRPIRMPRSFRRRPPVHHTPLQHT